MAGPRVNGAMGLWVRQPGMLSICSRVGCSGRKTRSCAVDVGVMRTRDRERVAAVAPVGVSRGRGAGADLGASMTACASCLTVGMRPAELMASAGSMMSLTL